MHVCVCLTLVSFIDNKLREKIAFAIASRTPMNSQHQLTAIISIYNLIWGFGSLMGLFMMIRKIDNISLKVEQKKFYSKEGGGGG